MRVIRSRGVVGPRLACTIRQKYTFALEHGEFGAVCYISIISLSGLTDTVPSRYSPNCLLCAGWAGLSLVDASANQRAPGDHSLHRAVARGMGARE